MEWRDHLKQLGVPVSPVQDRMYFKSIYFQAPDGLLLEIATDGPGFSVDEGVSDLGKTLQLPPWLEDRRGEIEGALEPLPPGEAPRGTPAGNSSGSGAQGESDSEGNGGTPTVTGAENKEGGS